ncbi:hypothetical protein [uncultured Campylobacter sp.]|uniref:hypothetical protein n=1 Tax=uncultured Campylobacter sp. TaxID=218934 RepID=UPI0026202185|nr:hypothetical protein [uncultured Campylobacter sp.]
MIFDEPYFIVVSLSARLKMRGICGGACGEASCDERRSSSLSGRTMWIFATSYGAFQTQSELVCDYFEDYFGCRVISSATAADKILLET